MPPLKKFGRMSHDDYVALTKIGEGTYGVVYKASLKKNGRIIAVKNIRLENEEEGVPTTTIREVCTLIELRHPNVVDLLDVIMTEKTLSLVFEFLSMDLKKFLDQIPNDEILAPDLLQSFTFQMCQAICYCHQRRIIHRDLKPQNLLVDVKTNTLKVADFGLARAIVIPIRAYTHEIVTLWYRPPEILLGAQRYHMGVDVWSVGCIFAEMARRRPVFPGDSEIDQLFRIFRTLGTPTPEQWPTMEHLPDYKSTFPIWRTNTLRDRLFGTLDDNGFNLLERCFVYDPMHRISAREILNHPYFDNFDTSKVPAGDYRGQMDLN